METETGYYDGQGIFHANTYLLPTPIPGVSTTQPIVSGQPYNIFPDIQPYIPYRYIPKLPDYSGNYFQQLLNQTWSIIDTGRQTANALSTASMIGSLATWVLPIATVYIFRKDIKKAVGFGAKAIL